MMLSKRRTSADGWLAIVIVVAVLVIDQIIKVWVKTHMCLGESIHVTDWFYIDFVENNGMAFGATFFNKLVLSLFRAVAIVAISWYVWKVCRREHRRGYVVVLAFIVAGAAGNMVDSMFYGLTFSASSPYYVSYLVPFGQGYAGFLTGKVVDMFYFPLIVSHYPEWMPWVGGEDFVFFSPVFNFADACITCGVIALLLFCRKDLEINYFKSDDNA